MLRDDPAARDRVERFVDELLQQPEAQPDFPMLRDVDDNELAGELHQINDAPPWPTGDAVEPNPPDE